MSKEQLPILTRTHWEELILASLIPLYTLSNTNIFQDYQEELVLLGVLVISSAKLRKTNTRLSNTRLETSAKWTARLNRNTLLVGCLRMRSLQRQKIVL